SGFNWSRFGPTVPFACAAASVWQPVHPALANTFAPAVGSPFSLKAGVIGACGAAGALPTIVTGVGLTTPSAPQPASTPHERRMRTARRTRRDSIGRDYHVTREAQGVWT